CQSRQHRNPPGAGQRARCECRIRPGSLHDAFAAEGGERRMMNAGFSILIYKDAGPMLLTACWTCDYCQRDYCQLELLFRRPADTNGVSKEQLLLEQEQAANRIPVLCVPRSSGYGSLNFSS